MMATSTLFLDTTPVEIGNLNSSSLPSLIADKYNKAKIIVLSDTNTYEHCWPLLQTNFDFLSTAEILVIDPGEENKSIEICTQLLESLLDYKIDRHDLLLTLGGGVVSDLGGFIASIYKRGLDFIHIPTSLLGMVDASIGGKTGINLQHYKNLIGTIRFPMATYIDPQFLYTLPEKELKNGMAEMFKHALIQDENLWEKLSAIKQLEELISESYIQRSVHIKIEIVKNDPTEKGLRKILNFGHTIGHALESYFFTHDPIDHGHAVALGMLCETHIATQQKKIEHATLQHVETVLLKWFDIPFIPQTEFPTIINLLYHDKKNYGNKIQCSLINRIGNCLFDQVIHEQECYMALDYLQKITRYNL